MKFQPYLAALAVSVLLFACKKQYSAISSDPTSSTVHVPLTKEQFNSLQTLLKTSHVKDSGGFMQLVRSVQSVHKTKISTDDPPPYEGEEDTWDAFYVEGGSQWDQVDVPFDVNPYDYVGTRAYNGIYRENQTFAIRGNQIIASIPFVVTCALDINSWYPVKISKGIGNQLQILPINGGWGTVTQTTANNWLDGETDQAGIHAEAQEVRTKVTSTTGAVKISTTADISVFKVGAELSAGFTIQTAENIYNQYTMDGVVMVTVQGYGTVGPPFITPYGQIHCTDVGILSN